MAQSDTGSDWDRFMSRARPTDRACDECGCKFYTKMGGGVTQCRNGHSPSPDMCPDCGEEILETHLGDLCGCE